MNVKVTVDRIIMEHIAHELKQLDLCRYEDYVRIVGIVGLIESITKGINESQPEEVKADG